MGDIKDATTTPVKTDVAANETPQTDPPVTTPPVPETDPLTEAQNACTDVLTNTAPGSEAHTYAAGVCAPVLTPGAGNLDPLAPLLPGAGSVDLTGPTVGQQQPQVGPTVERAAALESSDVTGPLFATPTPGQDTEAAVRDGLTNRLGYVPHRDVVRLVTDNAAVRDDGRIAIPDRDGIIALYAATYGIDPSAGRVVIAGENDRYTDVLEDNFHFGPEGVPDWGARGLLIRTIMTMNGMQPRHNSEMPGVVVIPNDEAHFAELAVAENRQAGKELVQFTGETIEPANQVRTAAGYLLRLRGQDPSDPVLLEAAETEVRHMLENPTRLPSGAGEMTAYSRTEADANMGDGQQWPRDAILEAYKDLFDNPEFADVPRDRLASMIMMTVAQTNNLDPDSFANCSQVLFISSERMASLIKDANTGDDSSHFVSLDRMAADIETLSGQNRTTAEMWQTILQHHAPGSGQAARRLVDSRPMPMVLIDSAAAMQPLSPEDIAKVEALLMRSANERGKQENPVVIPFVNVNIGGILQMARVWAAGHGESPTVERNGRPVGESILEWAKRTNSDMSPRDLLRLERKIERVTPEVRRVLGELEGVSGPRGWQWENGRLVLDDVANYEATIDSMPISAESRALLKSWVEGTVREGDAGQRTIDVERLGTLTLVNEITEELNERPVEKRESELGGIISWNNDLPPSYYNPPEYQDKLDDLYLYDDYYGVDTFNTYLEEGDTTSFLDVVEKMDMRVAAARHTSDQAKAQLAQDESRERATELRNHIAELRDDTKKYQETITLMNQIVTRWAAKGNSIRGPLTADLMAGLGLR